MQSFRQWLLTSFCRACGHGKLHLSNYFGALSSWLRLPE